jgi:hypothetical protein
MDAFGWLFGGEKDGSVLGGFSLSSLGKGSVSTKVLALVGTLAAIFLSLFSV